MLGGQFRMVFRLSRFAPALALVLLLPRVALAQSVTIFQAQSLPRVDAEGNQLQKRPLTLNPEGVSYQDCLDDQRIRFTLSLSGFTANGALEVWAGLSGNTCADQVARTGAAQTCWQVASGLPLQLQTQVDIPVRTIMKGARDPKATDTSAAICGAIDLTNISLNFHYYAPGQLATPAVNQAVPIKVDTIGPPPLSGVKVLPGDTRLHVTWTAVGEGGVQDLTGVSVYCAPASGATGTTTTTTVCNEAGTTTTDDAGDAGDAEATTDLDAGCKQVTSTDNASCSTSAFQRTNDASTGDIIPDNAFDEKYLCGRLSGNTGAGVTADTVAGQPLANNTQYVVAIAATDSFGNRGSLSSGLCETPEQTNDFWNAYKQSGGGAGGGFCSATGGAGAAGSGAALGVVALTAASMIRRKARRVRSGGRR